MKKIVIQAISILMVLLVFTFTGCQKVDLYQAGLEMTVLLGEMVSNEDYVDMYLGSSKEAIDKVRAKDYDTPIKVFSITPPSPERTIEELYKNNEEGKEQYEKLPETLKEQVKNQISFSSIIMIYLTSQKGVAFETISLINVFVAQKRKEGKLDKAIMYLYVFETGCPIMVEFIPSSNAEYNMVGRFFLVEECTTLSAIRTLLEPYGCEVSIVKG